ncbi:MAG: protoporphyrinogen oxidase, partial [Methyloligellaceae bacterium]
SGLTVAHELVRRGRNVVLLERQVMAGGNAISERIDGFLMEHGPSSLSSASEAAGELSARLGLERERVPLGPDVRYRHLTKAGKLAPVPVHPFGFLTAPYLSLTGRLRLLGEVVVPRKRRPGEETVAAFCSRRFGAEFAEKVIDPLAGGLFAARASELSMAATFPRLMDMERRHRSVTIAAARRFRRGGRMPARRLTSWRDGMGTLPRAIAAALGGRIHTGKAIRRIVPRPGGFRVEAGRHGAFDARSVVIATQPHVTGTFLESMDREAAEAALAIPAPPIAVVFLGYRRRQIAHPLDGIGYLTPETEGRDVTGALFPSTMFEGRAPEGHVALAAYVGGSRKPELAGAPAQSLVELVRDEFHDLLGARGDPVVARVRQWPRGLPQTCLGHQGRVAALTRAEELLPGLFLTGNYFSGPGVGACIDRAAQTAVRAEAHLQGLDRGAGAADIGRIGA